MKNKKLIFIIAAITVLVFFFIIDTIKGIQTNLEKRKNLTDSEKFIEDFGSFENYSFEELISKENFGSFTAFGFGFYNPDKNTHLPFYGTILENGSYTYKNKDLIKQLQEVFQKYHYTYSRFDFSGSAETINLIWLSEFHGYNDINLNLSVYEVVDTDMLLIYMYAQDNFNVSLNRGWFSKHTLGMFTDKKLSEDICALLQEYTKRISLAEIKQIISKNTGELSTKYLYEYQNSVYQQYTDNSSNDIYQIYKQELDNLDDYLLVYLTNLNVIIDEKSTRYNYIFKIELYGQDGTLKEVLYDDTERYENDIVRRRE